MLYGKRVRASIVGQPCVAVDYCAGADPVFLIHLLAVIVRIMEAFPESITEREVQDMMPGYDRRPIDEDPCWQKLQDMMNELHKDKEDGDV